MCASRIPTVRVSQSAAAARASCLAPATSMCGSSGGLSLRVQEFTTRGASAQLTAFQSPSLECVFLPPLARGGKGSARARSPQQQRHYQIQLINLSAMAILLRYMLLVRHDMMIQCRYGATFTKTSCIMQCKTRKWVGVLFNVRRYFYLNWPLK